MIIMYFFIIIQIQLLSIKIFNSLISHLNKLGNNQENETPKGSTPRHNSQTFGNIKNKFTDRQKQFLIGLLYKGPLTCTTSSTELLIEYSKTFNILLTSSWNDLSVDLFNIAIRLQWEAIHDSPISILY